MSVRWADLEPGVMVAIDKEGSYPTLRQWRWVNLNKGDELTVTRKMKDGTIWAKPVSGYGQTVRLNTKVVSKVTRPVGVPPEDGIDIEDPRIQWIFEDAARMANRLGLCKDYDRLMDALGWPGRERDIQLSYNDPAEGIRITATVRARSHREAERRLRTGSSNLRVTDMRELTP